MKLYSTLPLKGHDLLSLLSFYKKENYLIGRLEHEKLLRAAQTKQWSITVRRSKTVAPFVAAWGRVLLPNREARVTNNLIYML